MKSLVTSGEHLKLYPQRKIETLPNPKLFLPSPQKYNQKQTCPIRDRQNGSAFITASTEQQQV